MFLLLLISGVLTGPSLYGCVAAARRLMLHGRHHTLLLGCGQSALGGKFWLSPCQGPLQVCFSLQGMCALFVLFTGWLWVGGWTVLGVSVPLPPCLRAHRSTSTLLGGRGLVVAAHRVVMVALQLGSCAQGCHGYPTRSAIVLPYLSRHLPQAHLLLMSLTRT